MVIELEPLVKENPFDNIAHDPSERVSSPGSLRRSQDRRAASDLRKAREEWGSKTTTSVPKPRGKVMGVDPLTEDQMLICVPDVACFDLARKDWVLVDLNEIGDVAWNEDAFDDLIWPTEKKEILLAIAESYYQGGAGSFNDVLDKKSRGTTIMLTGPTGIGKSFAVEAVAEKLHMPLYSISVGDMIRDFNNFETRLEETLERCAKWKAILLVRNFDFFFKKTLEGTGAGDVCATILHHLERHQGLVFLTSWSLSPLNKLLTARFDLTLEVLTLPPELTRQIWANALSAVTSLRDRNFVAEHLDVLATKNVSGRGIRSVVKMASMLAKNKGVALKLEHLESVLRMQGLWVPLEGVSAEEPESGNQKQKGIDGGKDGSETKSGTETPDVE